MTFDGALASLLRLGTAEVPAGRRMLRAGPLCAVLEGGAVRHMTWRDVEVLRGAAYLVRDRDWGTPPAEITDLRVEEDEDGFRVAFDGIVPVGPARFRYVARITGTPAGRFDFAAEGVAEQSLETNRCGFVVLHPAAFAGLPLEVRHTGGGLERTAFPLTVSPGQPVLDIRGLRYGPAEGLNVTCALEAELPGDPAGRFEMEDQRNWSDASFKTYVGSLLDPWPYVMEAGRPYRQRVSLRVAEARRPASRRVGVPSALRFGPANGAHLPQVGIGVPQGAASCGPEAVEGVAALSPRWLVVSAELDAPDQRAQIAAAAEMAGRCGAAVQLELIVPAAASPAAEAGAAAALCAAAGLRPDAVLICPRALLRSYQPTDTWPDLPPAGTYHAATRAAFPAARVGGGVVTYFTELNRRRPSSEGLDFVAHALAPIIHAADDRSVMETLEALPHIARSVKAIWPGQGYRIGPSSLALRSNPYGRATVPNPDGRRLPLADRDPRQAGLFAAAWTVGVAAALAAEGVEVLALHHSHGPSGVLTGPGTPWRHLVPDARVLPVFHALRTLASAGGAPLLPVTEAPPGIAALAWRGLWGRAAVVANVTEEARRIALPGSWRVRRLDLPEIAGAARDPFWLDAAGDPADAVELGPYAVAFLHGHDP